MGNTPSTNAGRSLGLGLSSFVSELGNDVTYEKNLGTSRFLKTIRARHHAGRIVVKVFVKTDPTLSLKSQFKRLQAEIDLLQGCPHVLPYHRCVETEKAGYLVRQHLANNLYDRISTRPFLSIVEKKWIIFQLLTGLRNAVATGVSHGDIKSENVVVTSSNHAFLCDFASFKPTYLPEDDPADFSYFFDTSSRRTCYLAPERFYASDSEVAKKKASLGVGKRDGRVTEAMDVFGLGCVVAELFMDGTPTFTLSQLLNYRSGDFQLSQVVGSIQDEAIRLLVTSMLSLDPSDRLSCDEYLRDYRGSAFPDSFYTFLHPFLVNLQESISPPAPAFAPSQALLRPTGTRTPTAVPGVAAPGVTEDQPEALRTDADEIIERLWHDFAYVASHFALTDGAKETSAAQSSSTSMFPLQLHIPGYDRTLPSQASVEAPVDDDLALILLPILNTSLRNCRSPSSVSRALDLMLAMSRHLSDETILDRMLPYVMAVLSDDDAGAVVKSQALLTVTQLLLLVHMITPSNASVCTEYVIPNVRRCAVDPEEYVRCTVARCVTPLATVGKRFLEMTQAMRAAGTFKTTPASAEEAHESSYEYQLAELQRQIQDIVIQLLVDNSTAVKRSLLINIAPLTTFFGRAKTNDVLLSHMLTYLNESDWQLREAFFEAAIGLAPEVGSISVEEYLLPLMLQASADPEDYVSARVICSLAVLISTKSLSKAKIWETVTAVIGLICHPNSWIRQASARLIAAAASVLPSTDTWCILYPALRKLLRSDIKVIDELTILAHAEPPVSRIVYDAAVNWASRARNSTFWRIPVAQSTPQPPVSPQRPQKLAETRSLGRLDDDSAQLERLRQLGMKRQDEIKLAAMRERIVKSANARTRAPSSSGNGAPDLFEQPTGVGLQDLGVSLQNILLKTPTQDDTIARAVSGASRIHRVDSWPRRFSVDPNQSPGSVETPRAQRHDSPAADDLRRRLVTRNSSTASVGLTSPGIPSPTSLPTPDIYTVSAARLSQLSIGSSGDDNALASSSATLRPLPPVADGKSAKRVSQQGLGVAKVSPALAEDTTTALGTMGVDARYKVDDETMDLQSAFSQRQGSYAAALPSRFSSTYEGQDPNIRYLLERTYLDSYREPLPEFGTPVPPGIPRKRALRSSYPPRERQSRSPGGTLVGHLVEHTAAVTSIAVSPDFVFFATGSADGTVKIWDAVRLEKNTTSRSRHSLEVGGKVTCLSVLEASHCLAIASDNGTLKIYRVNVDLSSTLPKYTKPQLIRQHQFDVERTFITSMVDYNTTTSTNLVYATNRSQIVTLDVRSMRTLGTLQLPVQLGPVSALCLDGAQVWLVAGTLSGYLTLWDLRFGILLRTWRAFEGPIHHIKRHPTRGKGKCIVVAGTDAVGDDEETKQVVQVWDLSSDRVVQSFSIANKPEVAAKTAAADAAEPSSAPQASDPAAAITELLAQRGRSAPTSGSPRHTGQSAPRPDQKPTGSVQTFVIGTAYTTESLASSGELVAAPNDGSSGSKTLATKASGFLLTGGADRKIRFWDLAEVERSTVVSGLEADDDKPVFRAYTPDGADLTVFAEEPAPEPSSTSGRRTTNRPHRSTFISTALQNMQRNHSDGITALAVVDLPFRCIISGDRAGTIHVYE